MEEKKQREGCVGDIWHGLIGSGYKDLLMPSVIKPCLETPDNIGFHGVYHTYTKKVDDLTIRVTSARKDESKTMVFVTVIPVFSSEYENIVFEVEKVDVWSNGAEGTIEGSIFDGRTFSFFCQNYLDYKNKDLVGKKLRINISVVSKWAQVLPTKERVIVPEAGPVKGESITLENMRYLNPYFDSDPELCEFFFPVQDIKTIKFLGKDVYKIKGVLSNSEGDGNDYFYDVYINPSLVERPEELKIGEPFVGTGWLQGNIIGIV